MHGTEFGIFSSTLWLIVSVLRSPIAKASLMTTHSLDLFDNAMDSLGEALSKFQEGDAGDPKAYKFAVLHMAHFVELVFKHHIASKHPLLIYKDPFSQKIDRNKTIGLWDAINFINNESEGVISKELREDLEWLKRLRNDIEHHKFSMDVPQVRQTLGRLFRSVVTFLKKHTDVSVEAKIPAHTMAAFKTLSDEYVMRLSIALREAEAIEEANPSDPHDPEAAPTRLDCDDCGNRTMVVNTDSSSGYRCTMCGSEVGDELPASCSICGVTCTFGELVHWDNDFGEKEARCYYCSGQHHIDRDD